MDLLIDLHRDAERQGPGGAEETRLAIRLSGLGASTGLKIADIGCGTGASTLVLAEALDATITAVDLLPDFLERLTAAAKRQGAHDRIETLAASMDALPFGDEALDAIWSEGAIYTMGFGAGVRAWRRHLKTGGILAVSELTWLTAERPEELQRHWAQHYPEVGAASEKWAVLESAGYSPVGYFTLPRHCWIENYYRPMQGRFAAFLARNGAEAGAEAIIAAERAEIALYERFAEHVGYGFYIARKTAGQPAGAKPPAAA